MTILWSTAEQGSEAWLEARRGAITGSRAREARSRLAKGGFSRECLAYAFDTAREREGGIPPSKFQNAAMKTGQEQEPIGRMRYEAATGELVEEVGFAHTDDGRFGVSVDGLVGSDGIIEIKTMVSSDTLFTALVEGDIGAYRDQCLMSMWLLSRKWVDVVLWCPDLDLMRVIRIDRDEDEIQHLENDLLAFDALVESYRVKLRALIAPAHLQPVAGDAAVLAHADF